VNKKTALIVVLPLFRFFLQHWASIENWHPLLQIKTLASIICVRELNWTSIDALNDMSSRWQRAFFAFFFFFLVFSFLFFSVLLPSLRLKDTREVKNNHGEG